MLKTTVFWYVMSCSPVEVYMCFRRTFRCHLQDWRINEASKKQVASQTSCFIYILILKMKVVCCSETLVNFSQTMRHCILEDSTLCSHRCRKPNQTFKSIIVMSAVFWVYWPLLIRQIEESPFVVQCSFFLESLVCVVAEWSVMLTSCLHNAKRNM